MNCLKNRTKKYLKENVGEKMTYSNMSKLICPQTPNFIVEDIILIAIVVQSDHMLLATVSGKFTVFALCVKVGEHSHLVQV